MAMSKSTWQKVANGVVLLGVVVAALIWFGRSSMMGTRFEVSKDEAVNYSGDAKEDDARKLGEALKTTGYFDGTTSADVLLRKENGATTISFVVGDGKWNEEAVVKAFEALGAGLAPAVGGPPITVKLIDDKLNTRKEIAIK